jgi:hypothetical protein
MDEAAGARDGRQHRVAGRGDHEVVVGLAVEIAKKLYRAHFEGGESIAEKE